MATLVACECGHPHLVDAGGQIFPGCSWGDPMFSSCRCGEFRPASSAKVFVLIETPRRATLSPATWLASLSLLVLAAWLFLG